MYRNAIFMVAIAAMACGGGESLAPPNETREPSVMITSVEIDPNLNAFPGAIVMAKGEARDSKGKVSSTGITWEVDGVVVSGEVSLEKTLPPGNYTICLLFQGKKSCQSVTVSAPNPVRGQVLVATSSASAPSYNLFKVCAEWGTVKECADVGSAGTYSLVTRLTRRESLTLRVECKVSPCGFTTPEESTSTAALLGSSKNFTVLQKDWKIVTGRWAGASVPINLEKAYTKSGDSLSFFSAYRQSFWREQDLPIKLALDREGSGVPITAEDSTVMWASLNELNHELGRKYFTPANMSDLVAVRTLGQLPHVTGGIAVIVRNDSLSAAAGSTWLRGFSSNTAEEYCVGGIIQMSIHPLSTLRQGLVVKHEAVHTLGIGHTKEWYGIMSRAQNTANPLHGVATPVEVAHLQVWNAVNNLRVSQKGSEMPTLIAGERWAKSG